MTEECSTFFGKYRGIVENTLDPNGLGRIQVSVPDVYGDGNLSWALPCLPGAGPNVGLFTVPPIGAKVWIDFERGDPQFPVWSGGFWDDGDCPVPAGIENATTRAWVGDNFRLELNDTPSLGAGTLTVSTMSGDAVIDMQPGGLEITFGGCSVKLTSLGVTINGSNFEVKK
ncbi:MAG: phage baseplate assembly protein V [Pseudomonadota bacterium]